MNHPTLLGHVIYLVRFNSASGGGPRIFIFLEEWGPDPSKWLGIAGKPEILVCVCVCVFWGRPRILMWVLEAELEFSSESSKRTQVHRGQLSPKPTQSMGVAFDCFD